MDVQKIMEQVQVYASTYSLVGGRFDDGTRMEQAREEKAEIEAMLCEVADEMEETNRPASTRYYVGEKTMEKVFKPAGLTNLSNLQNVLDAIEAALDADVNP